MQEFDAQQVLLAIIQQAEEGKFQVFRQIKSWREFKHYYRLHRSTKVVIKVLKASATQVFNGYCKNVTSGISDVTQLLAYNELLDIQDFYEKDLKTLEDMLKEYDDYLGQGNFLYSILGGERDIWN
jgi:hypothetical protein